MAGYMSQTKKQLIEIIESLLRETATFNERNLLLSNEVESYHLQKAAIENENIRLKERVEHLEKENESLEMRLKNVEVKISENKKALERERANSSVFENLFISFSEKDDNKIILLDYNSLVLYASPAVLRLLNVNKDRLIGYSFLNMFTPIDSIRVQKKIKDVCLKDDKKKIKDVNFLTNEMIQMKLKLYPVQYMDQPAVKVIIKENTA
ncbi:MAG: PAS domain-containing protein [Desulfosalsimonadaceae bacterium]